MSICRAVRARWGFLYVCSVAVLICLAVPRQLLSFAGGYAFGPLFGAMFATLGVTLGCVLAFGMSRYCGRSFVERRYWASFAFNRYAVQRPFIRAIRSPVSVRNSRCSSPLCRSAASSMAFFSGSCLGYTSNLLFAMIGSGMRVDEGWRIGLSALLFAASCALGWWLYKRYAAAYPMGARNEH